MAAPCHPNALKEIGPSRTASGPYEISEYRYYRCEQCGERWLFIVTDLQGIERPDERHFEDWRPWDPTDGA